MKISKLSLLFEIVTEIGKAVWSSTLNILYLMVYSYALFVATFYYSGDISNLFMQLITFLTNNWMYFWLMFFSSKLYREWRWSKRRWY